MTHTGLSAEAVWEALEPLGWKMRVTTDDFAEFTPPSTKWSRMSIDIRATKRGSTWMNINIQHDFVQDMAPALAALSRLLGGDDDGE